MLHPNVTRMLDPETQRALDQLAAGGAVSQEDVKSIGNKTRKLTQMLRPIAHLAPRRRLLDMLACGMSA